MFEHVLVPEPSAGQSELLSDVFYAAMHTHNPAAATHTLVAKLGVRFNAKRAYIYELPPEGGEFVCSSEWCAPGVEPMSDVTHGLTMNMAARWFGDGEDRSLLAIRDLNKLVKISPAYAALFAPRNAHTQILGKLMRGNRPMGTLGFDDPDPQYFDLICELMYPICCFATATINTRNLLGRMRATGVVDKLTGAGTRMGFYEMAERLPSHIPVGLAYFDVVGLQGVNDVRGHEAGDELLVAIRQTLITEFQDQQVFRMAGDEFLIIAPGAGEAQFHDAMRRIRGRLNDLSIHVSVGSVWVPSLGNEYDALVRRAWLACSNDKQEWERNGGHRLEPEDESSLHRIAHDESADSALDIPCYRGDEFFRRANIWASHVATRRICMVAFDINYFKLYNDIYGREAGDFLLETYGKTLSILADTSHGVAGYLGGDNFAIVFPFEEGMDEQAMAKQMEAQLTKYAMAEGFSPSVGVVVANDTRTGMTILYDRASVALQTVKGSYTDHVSFYDERKYERERENQMLLIEAQNGVREGEFTFYLQPKVDISTNKVVSAEALVRWVHGGQTVPPYKFIELMERSGYVYALDRFIWEQVCKWQRSLIDRGITPVPVSVNVSRVDFYFTDLADHFASLIKKYDIPTRLIGIEVTESAYSKDADMINDVIRRMQCEGFLVFMDDFGSGYSSLNMLRTVSVDVLKIDKGFIDQADIHEGSDAIIANVINMAHEMGLPVISEGVETEVQRDLLRSMDCDYVQGYFYYRPMPIEQFEELLQSGDEVVDPVHSDHTIVSLDGA